MIRHCEDLNLKLKLCRIIVLSFLKGFVPVPLLSLTKKKKKKTMAKSSGLRAESLMTHLKSGFLKMASAL